MAKKNRGGTDLEQAYFRRRMAMLLAQKSRKRRMEIILREISDHPSVSSPGELWDTARFVSEPPK